MTSENAPPNSDGRFCIHQSQTAHVEIQPAKLSNERFLRSAKFVGVGGEVVLAS